MHGFDFEREIKDGIPAAYRCARIRGSRRRTGSPSEIAAARRTRKASFRTRPRQTDLRDVPDGTAFSRGAEKINGSRLRGCHECRRRFRGIKKENLPFERDENAPWALERQVRFAAGLLVLTGVLSSVFVHPYFVWLSAFVGAGLVFAAVTDTCAMGLLLAKMPWNSQPAVSGEME